MKIALTTIAVRICGLIAVIFCGTLCGCSRSGSEAREILGGPLPASATDVHTARHVWKLGSESFLSAAISREDYMALVGQLGLLHDPMLLELWPGALDGRGKPWWTVTRTNDADTFVGFTRYPLASSVRNTRYITNTVTRFESGRLFLRRSIIRQTAK